MQGRLMRAPAFIRRWLGINARQRSEPAAISHAAMDRARAFNRAQHEKREKGGSDACT